MRVSEIRAKQFCVNQGLGVFLKDHFIKNPQTTITLPFLTHNISAIGGVKYLQDSFEFF